MCTHKYCHLPLSQNDHCEQKQAHTYNDTATALAKATTMFSSSSYSAATMPVTVGTEDSPDEVELDENQQWRSTKKMSKEEVDVATVIKSFHEELDALTKNWEEWETNMAQHKTIGESTPFKKRPSYATYTTASKAPYSVKDPPPSAERLSPLRNYVNRSTPARRKGSSSSRASHHSSTLHSEPPPAPVQTPFPPSYATPNRFRAPPVERRMDPQDDTLVKLRQALDNQEKLIQQLQEENESLREQLTNHSRLGNDRERLFPTSSSLQPEPMDPRYTSSTREDFHHESQSRRYEEPNGRRPSSTTSTYRSSRMSTPARNIPSPPKRIHTTTTSIPEEHDGLEEFTPGTRFVAKLATLMRLEMGHHAPLSVILDRYWEELFDPSTNTPRA